jgi:hypothetical protein
MPVRLLAGALERLERMVQAFLNEVIGVGGVAAIFIANLLNNFREINLGHVVKLRAFAGG